VEYTSLVPLLECKPNCLPPHFRGLYSLDQISREEENLPPLGCVVVAAVWLMEESEMSLTTNAINKIYNEGALNLKPRLQVLDVKKIGGNEKDRYRVVLSDGVTYQQTMLATQLNMLVVNEQIRKFCIIQLDEYMCSEVSNRKIIIALALNVVDTSPTARIGNPNNTGAPGQSQGQSNQQGGAQQQHQQQQPRQQQQQQQQRSTYGTKSNNMNQNQQYMPIDSLNPYQPVWTIKARVTAKSDMRTWENARGKGHLCSVDLLDQQGGQIKATMFNAEADKFFNVFQADQVYIISKGQLKLANKKFNRLPSEYEITLGRESEVTFCQDDGNINKQQFDFVRIDELPNTDAGDYIDLCGVVKSIAPIANIMSRNGRELTKRTLTILDEGLLSVELTMWGDEARKYNEDELAGNPVVAFKSLKVGDYGGRSLSSSYGSKVMVNPDIPEAHKLRAWYDSKGRSADISSISSNRGGGKSSQRSTLAEISEIQLSPEKPEYFDVVATITHIASTMEKPPWYEACQKDSCNKKVTQSDQGYFCEKCNDTYSSFSPRYIMRLNASDNTGTKWVTAFNDSAVSIVQAEAKTLHGYKEEGNTVAYDDVFKKAQFATYVFTLRASMRRVEDEMRTELTVQRVKAVSFKEESQQLLEEIRAYA
jgi:replication factor A1